MDTQARDRVAIDGSNTQIAGIAAHAVVGQTFARSGKM